ncbi:RNA polymerase sigma factor [Paramicrobacterium fandaimingii]|uniref:RNA polymerase sigma factor n=1 Tax=Paramicrobacterium fandaimingii TaxID=2708079 RepID=UPI001AB02A82|nr:sigma-70 family RNA polymerase sigma factor [Microbacterium fandaimingii]
MKQPFEAVVTHHGATVLRVCRAVLGPHTDADDAWQETFVAAMGAYSDLPADANVEAWLVTIAHRKAIDVTRSRSRRPITVDELPDSASTLGNPESRDLDLWPRVAALPRKQRLVIAYHYVAGLPYSEIAALIGGSAAAARRAAADGIAALRKQHPVDVTAHEGEVDD